MLHSPSKLLRPKIHKLILYYLLFPVHIVVFTMETSDKFVDYYKVLQCERTATTEELKKSYQRMALSFHPDKVSSGSECETFLLVQKAWSVLRDPQTRKQYDATLSCQEHENLLLYETISLSDMDLDSEGFHTFQCRCGGMYCLDASETLNTKVVVPCNECSFSIEINT